MEQFKVALSSRSFFPVINLEATSQLLFKMFHPRAQALTLLHGDLGLRSSASLYVDQTYRLGTLALQM